MYDVVDLHDGKRLFYGAGPLHVACGQNTILRMTGTSKWEFGVVDGAKGRKGG